MSTLDTQFRYMRGSDCSTLPRMDSSEMVIVDGRKSLKVRMHQKLRWSTRPRSSRTKPPSSTPPDLNLLRRVSGTDDITSSSFGDVIVPHDVIDWTVTSDTSRVKGGISNSRTIERSGGRRQGRSSYLAEHPPDTILGLVNVKRTPSKNTSAELGAQKTLVISPEMLDIRMVRYVKPTELKPEVGTAYTNLRLPDIELRLVSTPERIDIRTKTPQVENNSLTTSKTVQDTLALGSISSGLVHSPYFQAPKDLRKSVPPTDPAVDFGMSRVRWSDQSYSVEELLESFSQRLPVIVRATRGFYGGVGGRVEGHCRPCRSSVELSPGQVLQVYSHCAQRRVMGTLDASGRTFSLALNSPASICRNVQLQDPQEVMRLAQLVECTQLPAHAEIGSDWMSDPPTRDGSAGDVSRELIPRKAMCWESVTLSCVRQCRFLLSSKINSGWLDCTDITIVPDQLLSRFQVAVDLPGTTKDEWADYCGMFARAARHFEYNRIDGYDGAIFDDWVDKIKPDDVDDITSTPNHANIRLGLRSESPISTRSDPLSASSSGGHLRPVARNHFPPYVSSESVQSSAQSSLPSRSNESLLPRKSRDRKTQSSDRPIRKNVLESLKAKKRRSKGRNIVINTHFDDLDGSDEFSPTFATSSQRSNVEPIHANLTDCWNRPTSSNQTQDDGGTPMVVFNTWTGARPVELTRNLNASDGSLDKILNVRNERKIYGQPKMGVLAKEFGSASSLHSSTEALRSINDASSTPIAAARQKTTSVHRPRSPEGNESDLEFFGSNWKINSQSKYDVERDPVLKANEFQNTLVHAEVYSDNSKTYTDRNTEVYLNGSKTYTGKNPDRLLEIDNNPLDRSGISNSEPNTPKRSDEIIRASSRSLNLNYVAKIGGLGQNDTYDTPRNFLTSSENLIKQKNLTQLYGSVDNLMDRRIPPPRAARQTKINGCHSDISTSFPARSQTLQISDSISVRKNRTRTGNRTGGSHLGGDLSLYSDDGYQTRESDSTVSSYEITLSRPVQLPPSSSVYF